MCCATISPTSLQDYREILFRVGVYNTVWRMGAYSFIWVCKNLLGEFRCGCKTTLSGEFHFISGYSRVIGKLRTLLQLKIRLGTRRRARLRHHHRHHHPSTTTTPTTNSSSYTTATNKTTIPLLHRSLL